MREIKSFPIVDNTSLISNQIMMTMKNYDHSTMNNWNNNAIKELLVNIIDFSLTLIRSFFPIIDPIDINNGFLTFKRLGNR